MDTTALRQKLLDLAIRGRLVPQNPDEPAVELDAKDIIPESEQPFEIPENWRWVKLSQIASKITDGTHHSPPNSSNGNYLYITAKNIKNNGIDLSNITYVTKDVHELIYARCNPEKGDILYIKDGATTGIATINQLEQPFSLLSSVALIKTTYNNKFIVHVMRSPFFLELIKGKMKGVAITRVTLKILNDCLLPFPPLSEQKRIVAKLKQLFDVIDRCEKARKQIAETATQLRTNLLQAAIRGKLVPQDPNDKPVEIDAKDIMPEEEQPFEIPENWRWVKLSLLVQKHIGGGTPSKDRDSYWGGNIPWASVKDLKNDRIMMTQDSITEEGLHASSSNFIPKGNLIVCMRMALGKIAINDIDLAINQDLRAIFLSENIISKLFFLNLYKTLKIEGNGVTVKGIKIKDLLNLSIPLPPLAEQKRIVAKLEQLFTAIETIRQLST